MVEHPSEPGSSPRIQLVKPLIFRAGPRPDQLGVRGLIVRQYGIGRETGVDKAAAGRRERFASWGVGFARLCRVPAATPVRCKSGP